MKKFRIGCSLGKLTCSQVVATVFTLSWAASPMTFAVERGRQEGKRVVREVVSRIAGMPQADSLLGQLLKMDTSTLRISNTARDIFMWERPEGTYVFGQMVVTDHNISGNVMLVHPDGQIVDATISRIAVLDDNRIDFDVASLPTAEAPAVSAVGSVVGIQSDPGTAIASASANGANSKLFMVNFNKADASPAAVMGSVSPITVTSFPASPTLGGAACWFGCIGDLIVAVVTAIVGAIIGVTLAAAVFVSFTCIAFGWFGCDSGFWWA